MFLALTALFISAAPANAKVQLQVDVGWEGFFRPGRWTPLYITATDSAPRQVLIEVYCPTDRRYALTVLQGVAIGPSPVTVPVYVPLSYSVDETSIKIRDANTSRTLESFILGDHPAFVNRGTGPQPVADQNLFVGISGNSSAFGIIKGQFNQQPNISAGYLPPPRLPAVAKGYDALDVLVLDQPDLNRLANDQQNAIVEWVRGGGVLVMWPGVAPIPASGPIMDILPARLGAPKTYELPKDKVTAVGLPPRFAKLTGRAVEAVTDDAKPVILFGSDALQAHRRWVGLGQVLLIPADLSTLTFNTGTQSVDFWRRALKDIIAVPPADQTAQPYYYGYGNDDPRRSAAITSAMNWIADVPGAGSFGFSWVALVLIAMMLIVGPVDWFVLKWMGRQPWTWITTTGWIGLVTLCAIYLGHIFKSGELHFRTVTMIDEAAGSRIAAIDLAGLYSPRTRAYDFDFDPQTWWRAASDSNYFGGGGLRIDIACHQDYRGNRPLPMLINVWNMRFLEGTDSAQAPAMLSAKLTAGEKEIQGTVTNESDVPVKIVALRTKRGVFRVNEQLPPGGSLNVSGKLTLRDNAFASSRPSQQDAWRYYNQQSGATTQPVASSIVELSAIRSDRIEQVLNDRSDAACIYAEFSSPTPRVKLNDDTAKRDQLGFIRALVSLKQ